MTLSTTRTGPDSTVSPDLTDWLYGEHEHALPLIVEVRVPQRRVAMKTGVRGQRGFAHHLLGDNGTQRADAIRKLAVYLQEDMGLPVKILASAGAIAVSVTPGQARRLAVHPLTKKLRLNRTLPARAAAG